MGKQKMPKIEKPPQGAPEVTAEAESVKAAGDDERRRIAAMNGRNKTVQSKYGQRGKTILG